MQVFSGLCFFLSNLIICLYLGPELSQEDIFLKMKLLHMRWASHQLLPGLLSFLFFFFFFSPVSLFSVGQTALSTSLSFVLGIFLNTLAANKVMGDGHS